MLVICDNVHKVLIRNSESIGWNILHFPREELDRTYFSKSTCDLLANLGLPEWAAPHLHFGSFEKDEWLPELNSWTWREKPVPDAYKKLIVIGCQESPICIQRNESIILIEPSDSNDFIFINSDVFKLVQSLALFADLIDIILGKQTDFHLKNPDFISDLCQEFFQKVSSLDPTILTEPSFWKREIEQKEIEFQRKFSV